MTIKIYGHPWSLNTRKTLMTLAEKQADYELALIMIPKGEQKLPEHIVRHPFAKVPVLEMDGGFTLYETRAINRYLDQKLPGIALTPPTPEEQARLDQWINIADSYFIPHAHSVIVELLFRKYLGGPQNTEVISAGRENMKPALDVADRRLASSSYFAGDSFSLADIHWMPYLEYLAQIGEKAVITSRKNLSAWWTRVSERPAWLEVARRGPQPYHDVTAEAVASSAGKKHSTRSSSSVIS